MPKKVRVDVDPSVIRESLEYSAETGLFRWLPNSQRSRAWNTRHTGKVAGYLDKGTGYVQIRFCGDLYLAHRMSFAFMEGRWPALDIDHANGKRADNRYANLREATHSENMRNRLIQRNDASGHLGIRFRPHHQKWEARIAVNRKIVWRKYFTSAQEAAAARREALPLYHGEYIRPD